MIHGIGVDIVRVARIERALDRFGDRFARRILSGAELEEFSAKRRPAEFLAKQFAAKEAFVKALGTGLRDGLCWGHIEVRRNALGKPYFICRERAQVLLDEFDVTAVHLSLSDEDDFAVAFVTMEGS